jgi:alpha-L-fucosidase
MRVVTASTYRGGSKTYSPENLTDNNPETYWATNDNEIISSVELELDKPQEVKYVLLQEYIKLGQRVKSFTIEVWSAGRWLPVAEATTIGYKRIVKLEPVQTDKIRISILDSKACPLISNVEIF